MLEIAGGILIAVAILATWDYVLAGVGIGIALAIVVGLWFALAAFVGEGWAWGISIAAFLIWLGWFGSQEAPEEKATAEEEAWTAKNQEAKRLAEKEKLEGWAKEQQARIVIWEADERARKEREQKAQNSRIEKMRADKRAEKEMCIKALRDGKDVIGIDGSKMALKDFGVYD